MKILATYSIPSKNRLYVLTQGGGSPTFDKAKELNDFAVYEGFADWSEDRVAREGDKVGREYAVQLFGGIYDLKPENFRR